MGNKHHRSSLGHHPPKAVKQLKIVKLLTTGGSVSSLPAGPPIALSNQFAILENEVLPTTQKLQVDTETSLPSPFKVVSDTVIELMPTHLAEHCWLTAQTVTAIFNNLQRVCHKMNAEECPLEKLSH